MSKKVVSIQAANLRNALSLARKELGLPKRPSATTFTLSGGEDSLWRITFNTGDVAEVTIVQHSKTKIIGIKDT